MDNIERLTQDIRRLCAGQETGSVLIALRDVTTEVLCSVSNEEVRAAFLISTHIDPLSCMMTYDDAIATPLAETLAEIVSIHDERKRNALVIGHIKALTEAASRALTKTAIESPDDDQDTFLQKFAALQTRFGDYC